MTTTLHRKIKEFTIDGEFADEALASSIKDLQERIIDTQMRDRGYIRALDMDSHWSVIFSPQSETWLFKITMYGFYIGRRKAWEYEGSWQGKLLPRNTRPITLNQ